MQLHVIHNKEKGIFEVKEVWEDGREIEIAEFFEHQNAQLYVDLFSEIWSIENSGGTVVQL